MRFYRYVSVLAAATTLYMSSGCGTILYPERRGQRTAAHVDVGVVVMDGLWCLLIIPGIIAFAVDFSNGAIYLPAGQASTDPVKVVKTPAAYPDKVAIERAVERQTGIHIRLDDPAVIQRRLAHGDDIVQKMAEARQDRRSF